MNETEKAIAYFEDAVRESDEIIADCSPNLQADLTEQKQHFVVALVIMRQAIVQPKPLSLEGLRQLDGNSDPAWVQDLLIPACSAWHFVRERDGEILLFDEVALARRIVGYNATTGHNYGKTWLAYVRRPREEKNG